MAGKPAVLQDGVRISDLMSVMVLASVFPLDTVRGVLAETHKESVRERNLPAALMVYYVIALALYRQASYQEVLRCIFESFQWISGSPDALPLSCKAAISQARSRLGQEPLRRLYEATVKAIATPATEGAFFHEWRIVSLDGSTLDLGDTDVNEAEFGRPGVSRGKGSAFPQLRFCALVENGTHVLFGAQVGSYTTGETTLAEAVVCHLQKSMLCLADRQFFGFKLWTAAAATGSELVWRVKHNLVLPCEQALPDGSYLSTVYATTKERRQRRNGVRVRVMRYQVTKPQDPEEETQFQLLTTILDHTRASAVELAQLYGQRWEIETTLDEFKTHLHGRDMVLRSKTPDGVYQEFWGLMLAHHAVRHIMHDAACKSGNAPNRLSYTHSLREIRRKLPLFLIIPPSGMETSL